MSPLSCREPADSRSAPRGFAAGALFAAFAACASLGATSLGCDGGSASSEGGGATTVTTTVSDGGGGGAGGEGGGTTTQQFASNREMFEKTVQPGLEQNCVACHQSGGFADFLALPDIYASVSVYKSGTTDKPILWPKPEESILYAYPDTSDHNGTPYGTELAGLKAAVLAWLKEEAKSLPPVEEGPVLSVVPFKPIIGGLNAIYLDPLGQGFENSAVTFFAKEIGSPPSILELTKLEVYPASGVAIRMIHPRFVVYPEGETVGIPDPADSLANIDQTFVAQEDATLSTGELLLPNWEPNGRISIDFSLGKIESLYLGDDGAVKVPCNDLGAYTAAVITLGDNGPMYCAENCHGGNKAEAKAAMNLSGLLKDPPDYASACAFMRSRITPGDVDGSQIMNVTDPKQPQVVHMYKFKGNTDAYNAFKTGMTEWILSE